jgi:uncharacterized protein YkwD
MRATRMSPFAIALVLGLLAAPAASACEGADAPPSQLTVEGAREAVVCLINETRSNHGLGALGQDGRLNGAAQGHSNAMNRRNFFAHGNFERRIRRSGYLAGASSWAIGENIYWGQAGRGTPAGAVAGWMNSPPHREAILNGRYRDLGIGIAVGSPNGGGGGNTAIYTADFGDRG